jgi:hypothetical protein
MIGGRDCLGEGLVSLGDCVGVVGSGWLGLLRV